MLYCSHRNRVLHCFFRETTLYKVAIKNNDGTIRIMRKYVRQFTSNLLALHVVPQTLADLLASVDQKRETVDHEATHNQTD